MSEYDDNTATDLDQDTAWYNDGFGKPLDDGELLSDKVDKVLDELSSDPTNDDAQTGEQDKTPNEPKKEPKPTVKTQFTPQLQTEPTQELKRPILDDFDDYGAYEDAMEEYYIAKAEQRYEAKQAERQEREREQALQREFSQAVDELASEGVDIVALQAQAEKLPPLPVSLDNFGLSVKDTLKLAKDLMDNTALYYELAEMNPYQMAMRVGRFLDEQAGGQTAPQAPSKSKQSKAPPPINPVTASGTVVKDPNEMSDDDWYKQQIKNRRA